jgi:hypothetical protein
MTVPVIVGQDTILPWLASPQRTTQVVAHVTTSSSSVKRVDKAFLGREQDYQHLSHSK